MKTDEKCRGLLDRFVALSGGICEPTEVYDELFPTFDTFFKQLVSVQDEGSLDSSSLKAFQNKTQVGCFCMLCYCSQKDEIKNKCSALNLLGYCLWFHGFP